MQKIDMELQLIVTKPDFSLPNQKELYLSHPYDKDFLSFMDKVVETGTLPRFVTLSWFVWWFLQSRHESCHLLEEGKGAIDEKRELVLDKKQLIVKYWDWNYDDPEGEATLTRDYAISLEGIKSYADLTSRLWISDQEPHTPWFYYDQKMDFIAEEWKKELLKTSKNNNFTEKEFEARIRGNHESFDNSAELYLPGKAVFQIFTENNQELCFVHNTLSGNLPNLECNKWYHKEGSPYHYFATKVGRAKLINIYDQMVVYFKLRYVMVLDWAYRHFLNHHLDRLLAYSNHDWNLEELQSYAQTTWGVESKDRAEIIKEIKEIIHHTVDWVDNLTVENL